VLQPAFQASVLRNFPSLLSLLRQDHDLTQFVLALPASPRASDKEGQGVPAAAAAAAAASSAVGGGKAVDFQVQGTEEEAAEDQER